MNDITGSASRRYNEDPAFKQLVDMMEYHLHHANYTPTELRQGAILAAIHFEYHRVRMTVLDPDLRSILFRDIDALHKRVDAATAEELTPDHDLRDSHPAPHDG